MWSTFIFALFFLLQFYWIIVILFLHSDLSGVSSLKQLILSSFSPSSEEVKSAASYALGSIAIGNLQQYLPFILQEIETQLKRQYLLLHSLKEVIFLCICLLYFKIFLDFCVRNFLIYSILIFLCQLTLLCTHSMNSSFGLFTIPSFIFIQHI